jgi:hypothetical protein
VLYDANSTAKIYLNNVLDNNTSIGGVTDDLSGTPTFMYIGAESGTPNFNGYLDNLNLFADIYSADQMTYLWNGGNGQELMTTGDFFTVFHYDVTDPGTIIEDGDFDINVGVLDLDEPADGDWIYYRTQTNSTYSTESAVSENTAVNIDTSVAGQYPSADAGNLTLTQIADGAFLLRWNYNSPIDDPITKFNIYIDLDGDPSANNFGLEASVTYSTFSNQFSYITAGNAHDKLLYYKIVPANDTFERDNDVIIGGIADALAPIVVTSTVVTTVSQ